MAIKVNYSPLMLRKAAQMVQEAQAIASGKNRSELRDDYSQRKFGLSLDYLKKIGRVHKRPSARVLENMGLELWVRDPSTGEEEKLEFDHQWNWTPRQPTLIERNKED